MGRLLTAAVVAIVHDILSHWPWQAHSIRPNPRVAAAAACAAEATGSRWVAIVRYPMWAAHPIDVAALGMNGQSAQSQCVQLAAAAAAVDAADGDARAASLCLADSCRSYA